MAPGDIVRHDDIPVTSPAQTLVDLATELDSDLEIYFRRILRAAQLPTSSGRTSGWSSRRMAPLPPLVTTIAMLRRRIRF
ncbi:MAG TPA: hypothetical protein VF125_04475 [Solirubrobacterales bacterium]